MAGGGWSCPHEVNGLCSKVNQRPCEPGMKGCELYARYVFFDGSKNERLLEKQARTALATSDPTADQDSSQGTPARPFQDQKLS